MDRVPIYDLDERTPIWRYTPFPQFSRVLQTSELFLCRADLLADPWEATFPDFMFDVDFWSRWLIQRNAQIRTERDASEAAVSLIAQLRELHRERDRYAVSCWHANEMESEPFWKLYSDIEFGVAVRTTVGSLATSLGSAPSTCVRPVRYMDHRQASEDLGEFFIPAVFKRIDFKHEQEVRLLCHDYLARNAFDGAAGISFRVDLSELLHEVVVSPKAPLWFVDHVQATVHRFGFDRVVVRPSTLYEKPSRVAAPVVRTGHGSRFESASQLVVFRDRAEYEAWRRHEMAKWHYPRFGMRAMGVALTGGLTTEISTPEPHPNKSDPAFLPKCHGLIAPMA